MTARIAIVRADSKPKNTPLPDPFFFFFLIFFFPLPDLRQWGEERGEGRGAMVSTRDFGRDLAWPCSRNDLMTGVRFGSSITPRFPILQGIQICNSFKIQGQFFMAEVEAL